MFGFERLIALERQFIWDKDYSDAPAWQRYAIEAVRSVFYLYRQFASGELNLRAMSLVYTTILSLVPLLAFSFSVLKGFGVQNQVEPLLLEYFSALGEEKAAEITNRIVEFVNNIDVRVLGAVGLGLLIYTVVTLMQKIEAAFNRAWHVHVERSFAERFSTFVSVLTVGPLLVFAALAITGSVMNNAIAQKITSYEPFGTIAHEVAHFAPYLLVTGAFTFVYILIPNTRVKFVPALVGGIVAGFLWESAGYVFALFVATAASYQAVYATFGTAMFFMIWLYVSWLILLVGANVAYYVQQPNIVVARVRNWRFSYETFVAVAVALLARMVRSHYAGTPPYNLIQLSVAQRVPPEMVEKVLAALESERIVNRTANKPEEFVLAIPPEETRVVDVIRAMRRHQPAGSRRVDLGNEPLAQSLVEKIDHGIDTALGDLTLKVLAENTEAAER